MEIDDLTIIIMAAGKGTRLYPYSKRTPKVLVKIGSKTLLERNLEIVKNKLKKNEVHIVLSENSKEIIKYLEDRNNLDIQINYHHISKENIDKGMLYALWQLRPIITSHFMILLGDEVYFSSDHEKMLDEMRVNDDFDIYCMVKNANSPVEILKNYSVGVNNGKIIAIKEKPTKLINSYAGLGTIACSENIFDLMEKEYNKPNPCHFIDILDCGIKQDLRAYYYVTQCEYYNINSKEDLFQSRFYHRSKKITSYKKSLIIPAYNEAGTIGYVVKDFKRYVDDILVMENMSTDGTAEIARKAGARVFSRKLKGYGDAIRQGLEEAKGDILIITEADLTFRADDLPKIIEYLKDADAVIGTRTSRGFIHNDANMDFLLRLGNVLFGKLISILWWNRRCRLSDVGCTYRALWRESYEGIKGSLSSNGPEFSPEMMVEILNSFLRMVEIPVSYQNRIVGESKISISSWHSVIVASRMLYWIIYKRTQGWLNNLYNLLRNVEESRMPYK